MSDSQGNAQPRPASPAVSVVIPLYNKEREVERAIRSVLAQTVQDFEVVVVNDGSTDRGPEIVASIADPRIRLIHQDNQGVSAARNRGIAESRSDLIAFLDADDEWKPWFLETVLRLRSKFPQAGVFATHYLFCDGEGKYSVPGLRGVPPPPWEGILENYFAVASRSDPPLWTSAVAVTKAAITAVGGFPVGVKSGEDLLTWARLATRCGIAYASRPSAIFWRPQSVWDRPGRFAEEADGLVAAGLRALLIEAPPTRKPDIRRYLSLWHRSRAHSLIRIGAMSKARRQILSALRQQPTSPKLWAYVGLALMPGPICRRAHAMTIAARRRLATLLKRTGPRTHQRAESS